MTYIGTQLKTDETPSVKLLLSARRTMLSNRGGTVDYITANGLADAVDRLPAAVEIETCERWLRECAEPRKTINARAYSYYLKHVVENWANLYISNGAFIQAAVNLGYRYARTGLNASFNMRLKRS